MTATSTPQQVTYFKRYRMEKDLAGSLPAVPGLGAEYSWLAWQERLLECHAEVKYLCFCGELDGVVFPNLSNRSGCLRLMQEICHRPGFLPGATWLLAEGFTMIGTVQGIADRTGCGGIQNLGVLPTHRGKGLGLALLLQALHGFRRAGLKHATLEVTAQNETAIRLYRQIGFRFRKTLYKVVEPQTYPLEHSTEPEWVV